MPPALRRSVPEVCPLVISRFGPIYAGDWVRAQHHRHWMTAVSIGRSDGHLWVNCRTQKGWSRAVRLGDISRVAPMSPHPPGLCHTQ